MASQHLKDADPDVDSTAAAIQPPAEAATPAASRATKRATHRASQKAGDRGSFLAVLSDGLGIGTDSLKQAQELEVVPHVSDMDMLLFGLETPDAKQKVREHQEELRKVAKLQSTNPMRHFCYRLCNNQYFQAIVGGFIILNIVLNMVEADHNARNVGKEVQDDANAEVLNFLEVCFNLGFGLEILLRLAGCIRKPWTDGWLVADILIVGVGSVDSMVLARLSGRETFSALAIVRVMRAVRAARVLRIVRFVQPLRVMVQALREAFWCAFWVFLTVAVFTFVIGVVFTGTVGVLLLGDDAQHLGHEIAEIGEQFSSVARSMVTLYVVFLHGVPWGSELTEPLTALEGNSSTMASAGLILAYVVFTLFCLVNLINGMFISSLLGASERRKNEIDQGALEAGVRSMQHLRDFYAEMDRNGDGNLTWTEFEDGLLNKPDIVGILGVELAKADAVFRQLDLDGSGVVNVDEFLMGIIKITRTSKTIDMLGVNFDQLKVKRGLKLLTFGKAADIESIHECANNIDAYKTSVDNRLVRFHRDLVNVEASLRPNEGGAADAALEPVREPSGEETKMDCFMREMEGRYGFVGRLAEVERLAAELKRKVLSESLAEAVVDADAVADAGSAKPEASSTAASGSTSAGSALWQEIMDCEVLPWLRKVLPGQELA